MRLFSILLTIVLLLAGCEKQDKGRIKVLIGETAIVAPGAQPIQDAIIVIEGKKIRSVGERKDVPVPQNSDRTDLTGEWVVPGDGSRISIDEIADLIILKHAPNGITPANPSDISSRFRAGEWEINNRQ